VCRSRGKHNPTVSETHCLRAANRHIGYGIKVPRRLRTRTIARRTAAVLAQERCGPSMPFPRRPQEHVLGGEYRSSQVRATATAPATPLARRFHPTAARPQHKADRINVAGGRGRRSRRQLAELGSPGAGRLPEPSLPPESRQRAHRKMVDGLRIQREPVGRPGHPPLGDRQMLASRGVHERIHLPRSTSADAAAASRRDVGVQRNYGPVRPPHHALQHQHDTRRREGRPGTKAAFSQVAADPAACARKPP